MQADLSFCLSIVERDCCCLWKNVHHRPIHTLLQDCPTLHPPTTRCYLSRAVLMILCTHSPYLVNWFSAKIKQYFWSIDDWMLVCYRNIFVRKKPVQLMIIMITIKMLDLTINMINLYCMFNYIFLWTISTNFITYNKFCQLITFVYRFVVWLLGKPQMWHKWQKEQQLHVVQ